MAASSGTAESPLGGRPRDLRIDDAVLQATVELLEEVGYLRLSIAAIAERAGTNKPAIYRRWPTKAQLVHEAVFPVPDQAGAAASAGDLRDDIRSLVALGVDFLGRPAARAALPGLMAEMADDPALHAHVLRRFETASWAWLQQRIDEAIDVGEVRPDVEPATVLELIAGSALVATAIRARGDLDAAWIDHIVDLIIRGIAA